MARTARKTKATCNNVQCERRSLLNLERSAGKRRSKKKRCMPRWCGVMVCLLRFAYICLLLVPPTTKHGWHHATGTHSSECRVRAAMKQGSRLPGMVINKSRMGSLPVNPSFIRGGLAYPIQRHPHIMHSDMYNMTRYE